MLHRYLNTLDHYLSYILLNKLYIYIYQNCQFIDLIVGAVPTKTLLVVTFSCMYALESPINYTQPHLTGLTSTKILMYLIIRLHGKVPHAFQFEILVGPLRRKNMFIIHINIIQLIITWFNNICSFIHLSFYNHQIIILIFKRKCPAEGI